MARHRKRRVARVAYGPRLVIMAKMPKAGRVKRRLAREIGGTAATQFARTCLGHTLARLGADQRWETYLAAAPDPEAGASLGSAGSRRIKRLRQGAGDLGQRMQRIFQRLPPGPAIIVGGDIPAIGASDIALAFRLLGGADAVLGPAPDGGYWLVGMRRAPRVIAPFARVRWSTPQALADTLNNLEGSRVAFAATLGDVDDADDYAGHRAWWQCLIPPRSARPRPA
ncbi:MAG: TIGR04282 family arsenosugar biosynthesis glycosyltransferase [Methyloceanibacter sp.]|jgi:rSAM/selenodomain-associated transferase 1